ncbi:hypothetical protein Tco_0656325 [Tanacetum coccineum]|uniref:Uncharacterized protein n=1 Tax=Tanacetum coccineum TaxID=301880 RepID=A0ABQ4X8H0_9ASTR
MLSRKLEVDHQSDMGYELIRRNKQANLFILSKEMDLETTQTNAAAKLPRLKQENDNSFKLTARTTANADGTFTSMMPGPVTTEEKAQKKNDIKARSIFGGNDATKKTQKTLLKQSYENFNAPSTKSLDSIFNRLQKIISQLTILGENISQEDLNLKFLRSLPSEWNTHVVVWRNKPDLKTMIFDDLYNNFKIVEQEVKRTVSTPNSSVSTDSTLDSTASLSDATIYAFLANQANGSQLVHED